MWSELHLEMTLVYFLDNYMLGNQEGKNQITLSVITKSTNNAEKAYQTIK